MRKSPRHACALAAILLGLGLAGPAGATIIYLSTVTSGSIGGVDFEDGDVVRYDDITDTAVLFFSESLFAGSSNIDAFQPLDNGNLVLSTFNVATLGGLSFEDGDLIEYDPLTDTATLFFDEDLFTGPADIDAVHVLADGRILLSTDASQTLAGLAFRDGDIVVYDPFLGTATLFFSEDAFASDVNVDALYVFDNGDLVFSTVDSAEIAGLPFRDGDLVRYDPLSGTASLLFSEDAFAGDEDIDAVHVVPEPASGALLGLGLAALAARRGARRRGQGPRTVRRLSTFAAVVACLAAAGPAEALYLSTSNNATLGGLSFRDGDVVFYDFATDTATLFFSEDAFATNENVDAFSILANGNLVLSTTTSASLGGLSFGPGDLVEYDMSADTATLFFDQSLFSDAADIDALSLLPDGTFLLSTAAGETLGGLSFRDGDVVLYNPLLDVATLFFSEDHFSQNENVDGVSLFSDSSLLLSTANSATLGGITFGDGDVVRYDPFLDIAEIFFAESLITGSGNIDAAFVPEPSSGALVALGLSLLAARGRSSRR